MSNLSRLRAIGRQIEQDNRQFVADEAGSYRAIFWQNPFQQFGYRFAELIPAVRRTHVNIDAEFLKLVQEAKPQIVAQYEEYGRQFQRWEEENRHHGCGSQDTKSREQRAAHEAQRLTSELYVKLASIGWPYRNLATFDELVRAYEGYLRMDAAWTYWEQIEKFLVARSIR